MTSSKTEKSFRDQQIENFEVQLEELESLESVFYNPGEIRVEDSATLQDIKDFIKTKTTVVPYCCLDLTINLSSLAITREGSSNATTKVELCCTMPHEYPNVEPEIFVRCDKLNKNQAIKINKDLNAYLKQIFNGEPCIFSGVTWVQENINEYVTEINISDKRLCAKNKEEDTDLMRYWIYSHHIYSKTKRREIQNLAESLNLSGFCMPGKPGIICVEGQATDCDEWWQIIKSMNWKKIFVKLTEENTEKVDAKVFLKFDGFNEAIFQNRGVKFNHMDMGELLKYLEEHNVAYIFKELFGSLGTSP